MVVDIATETTNATREAALDYAARGWPVFPLHSCDADGHCTCRDPRCRWPANKSAGKHPRIRGWREKATTKPETIRDWWRRWPSANVGIAVPPGMIVLDVDGAEGRENVEALPVTPSVSTGRGFHLYFKAPEGVAVRNGAGLRPGLDLRTAGGYVVAPPSIHGSGTVYEWSIHPDETPLADCPKWLAELLRDRERPARSSSRRDAVTAEPQEGRIPEGRRNATLTTLAGKLRDAGFRFDELTDTLLTANARRCDPPLEQGEVRAIARSVAGYPAGPVRVDRRIANADLKDGPRFLAMMLQAGVDDHDLAAVAGVTERTLGRWWKALRDAKLETIARTRPTRRYIELPRAMMTDETLSTAAKVTALAIGTYMKDGAAQVGQEKLADRRDRERARVSNDVTALEAAGYLMVSRVLYCKAQGRRDRPNRYRWREEEMRPRDNEMAREAPAEAREAESTTQKARLRARGHQEHVTTEGHAVGGPCSTRGGPCSTREGSTPKPFTKSDGGANAPSAVPDAPDLPENTPDAQRLARVAGLSVEYIQRMIDHHGLATVSEALIGNGRLSV